MHNLTFRQLRSIQTIDKTRKISTAAREIGLTAPAVTLQLQQVEEASEIQLFERSKFGMQTTMAGRAYVEAAGAIEGILRQLEDKIDALKDGKSGRIRLGIVSTAKYFAPYLVAGFAKSNPDVEIVMTVGNREQLLEMLHSHEADLFIMGRPPNNINVNSFIFGDHPLVVIAPPDHPLANMANKGEISKERIADETFLIREKGSGTRTSLEIYLGEIPGRLDSLGIEMDSIETIKQSVMAGMGIGVISAHTIAQEVETGRMVILHVEGMPIKRQWFSVTRAGMAISPAMASFQQFLQSNATRYFPQFPVQ
ncbi:MAG: LysR family transcriptional regulator [Hyphomicrobiales bacterium]|nr:LysR family transcriptional regulator [Hyphomicrobiales bacterium]